MLVILQLWLLTATMNAYLGGDEAVVCRPRRPASLCLLLNAGLLRYLYTSSHATVTPRRAAAVARCTRRTSRWSMATGIVSIAAHLLGMPAVAWRCSC